MAQQTFKQQLEELLGKRRRGVGVKWDPTHRAVVDASHRDITRALGRGLKDDVHDYTFWDVATDDFDSDFAPTGEFIQLSNRDFRSAGMIYEPKMNKTVSGRDEWFALGTSPRAIRALADEIGGSAFGIESLEKKAKAKKLTAAETRGRAKAEEAFKKKLEKLGYTVRLSHLRGRSITVRGEKGIFHRAVPNVAGVWLVAWETNLFRFYYVKDWQPSSLKRTDDVKVSFREARVIPAKPWRMEKMGLADAMEKEPRLSKRRGMEYPDIHAREWYHYQ